MNCGEWEERIALYAGGDLAPAEAQAVERHAAECAGCRRLLSGLRENLEWMRETHAETVEAAHFAAVRARVLAELERGRKLRWRYAWLGAIAAASIAALALFLAVWPGPEGTPAMRLALPMPPAPAAPAVVKVARAPVAPARVAHTARQAETILVKLETDDPDVVIYWIAESKGETK